MTRLHQILAIDKTLRGDTEKAVTLLHRQVQKEPSLSGFSKTYRKINDEDPDLPGSSELVQVRASKVLEEAAARLARLFDVTAARDYTNCKARADIVVGGHTLLENVPATYLLYLQKALINVETLVRKLPVLDPAEDWQYDPATDTYRTPASTTTRGKKIPRNHVKAKATDKHAEQVEVYFEDTIVGYWDTVKYSGALPAQRVNELLDRVIALSEAVKFARETANTAEIDDPKPGKVIFDWLFR